MRGKRYRYRKSAYKARKFKMPRRLIFFAVIAVVIFGITVLIGNILKNKIDNEVIDKTPVETYVDTEPSVEKTVLADHDGDLLQIKAPCFDLTLFKDKDAIDKRFFEIIASHANGITIPVTDPSGLLTYASPVISEYSRLMPSSDLVSYDTLCEIISKAKSYGLHVSAIMSISDTDNDRKIVSELIGAGIDDITFTGFAEEELTAEDADTICGYIEAVSYSEDIDSGICLNQNVYLDAKSTPNLEKVYGACNFLAIDLSSQTVEDIAEITDRIGDAFFTFSIRPVLSGEDIDYSASVDTVLQDNGIDARLYCTASIPQVREDTTAGNNTAPMEADNVKSN